MAFENAVAVRKEEGCVKGPPRHPVSMTKRRVYVTLGKDGSPKYISYYDAENIYGGITTCFINLTV